nr:class I SAM-dependent methyltransferase [Chloroflexia bacterium]
VEPPLLEVGCGTGGLLVAAAGDFDRVVGVDIAFRWLIVARKRLAEAGCANVQLVCCCAEALPFPDGTFGLVVAANVIEHSTHQEPLVREALRAVRPGGVAFFSTPNRFALAPEPHVHVWGVGLLPRRLMPAWVRLVRGVPYRHHRLLSVFELRRVLKRAGAERSRIVLPRITSPELTGRGRWVRRGAAFYGALLGVPAARWALYLWGPAFHAVAWRRPTEGKRTG